MIDIEKCKSISDICRKLGWEPTGGNRRKVKKLLEKEGINPEEWLLSKQNSIKEKEIKEITSIQKRGCTDLGKAIQELRLQGLTYKQISEQLGCSKATVCYWCRSDQKQKVDDRKERLGWKATLYDRISAFQHRVKNDFVQERYSNWKDCLDNRIKYFKYRAKGFIMATWTTEDLINRFGMRPKCYLTGKELNFEDPDSYCLDHIVPVSRGGTNDLDNVGITSPLINMSKTSFTKDEFLDMCEEVLKYNGRM